VCEAVCPANVFLDISQHSGVALDRMIGCGSFAVVYLGTNQQTGEEVAVKVESAKTKVPQLLYEAKVYKSLARRGDSQVPKVHWHGSVGDLNIMVMDLLGPSLEDVFVSWGRSISQTETTRLGLKMLSSVEYLHSMGFIHRDIKPENFVFKQGNLDSLHLIDFGLAKKYKDKTQDHIALQTNKAHLGDSVFASLRTHFGLQQSRRDDLESVAYILLYLSNGFLPWTCLNSKQMKELKGSSCIEALCSTQIARFLRYARDLSFEETPSYRRLRKHLKEHSAPKPKSKIALWPKNPRLCEYNFVSDWTFHLASQSTTATTFHSHRTN